MPARPDPIHRLRAALLVGALLVAVGLPPSARAANPPPTGSDLLSNERTFTRWAFAHDRQPIHKAPHRDAKRLARVRSTTEDGRPEIYLLLRRWTDSRGVDWLQVRIPMRPNGRIGWVQASALGRPRLILTRLTINRRGLRATLHRAGRRVWSSPVGIGARGTPTPRGRFWIREKLRSSDPGGLYGPLAFGTSAYSRLSEWPGGGVIGIHGTNQPGLIPGRPSHGCIRVPNRKIRRLARLMPLGTPVRIL